MRLRSPRELGFRAWQAALGAADYLLPAPHFAGDIDATPMPDMGKWGTPEAIRDLAEKILRHEFPIFGEIIETGPSIAWRRDYRHGVETAIEWFRGIPYLDFGRCGDHKYIWELNRHQHLVVLAQAWAVFHDPRYAREIEAQVESWDAQNPYLRSVNWASSLELAFRSISWIWVLHLAGAALDTRRLTGLLYRHGKAIAHHLSTYFAPNTHLLGEGVALHAIGLVLGVPAWERSGARIVREQLFSQVQPDGFHFEQSSYYHRYALEMFHFHYLLAGKPEVFEPVLARMEDAMDALIDERGGFPLIGDDDGGRFRFLCLASESPRPRRDRCEHSPSCGLTVFRRADVRLTFDCGPLARGGAGHSHADSLALTLSARGEEVLIDPGTFTYVADPVLRDWFRGTGAHSTIRLNAMDQADAAGPFRWENKPAVRRTASGQWTASGECSYRGLTHRRSINLTDAKLLIITDEVEGRAEVEQIWHINPPADRIELDPRLQVAVSEAWRSRVYGSRERSHLLVGRTCAPFQAPLVTRIHL